eukprot:SAG11_NODE_10346_length_837_cov_387.695122_2_plen_55_part_00
MKIHPYLYGYLQVYQALYWIFGSSIWTVSYCPVLAYCTVIFALNRIDQAELSVL